MRREPGRWAIVWVVLLASPVFLAGQGWGLPTREADQYLFSDRAPWSGGRILELSGGWNADPRQGADVGNHPLSDRERLAPLNGTDVQRARIALRYRLFSHQPDEMITFRALSGMRPGHAPRGGLDPRLYQYGGLWIYPVGALLKLGSIFGVITLRSNVDYYLEHPESFAAFYVVARLYCAAWGLVGVAAVYQIVRRICGGWAFPAAGALLFAMLPVVVNCAHEAKPHLPAAVIMLLAVLAGSVYAETGRGRFALAAGALCGAATGMLLSAYPVFLILPVSAILARSRTAALPLAAAGAGLLVYVITNPYVAINLLADRAVLASNLGNSSAMYHASLTAAGAWNALTLLAAGSGAFVALGGAIASFLLLRRAIGVGASEDAAERRRRSTGLLLASPAIWIFCQFVLFATDKPAEFARFALYVDIFLAIELVVAVQTFIRSSPSVAAAFSSPPLRGYGRFWAMPPIVLILVATGLQGAAYLHGFLSDTGEGSTRSRLAKTLAALNGVGRRVLVIEAEPAPYCLPPVDLFRWEILLAPRGSGAPREVRPEAVWVRPVDGSRYNLRETPISWANKRFEIR